MALLNLSIEHGRSLAEARTCLQLVVSQVQARFGLLMQRVEWSADRTAVKMAGIGFFVDLKVDPQHVHLTGDVPALGGLLGSPLAAGVKQIVKQAFQKRMAGGK